MAKAPTTRRKPATTAPAPDLEKILEEVGEGIGAAFKERLAETEATMEAIDNKVDTLGVGIGELGTQVNDLREEFKAFIDRPQFPRAAAEALLRGVKAGLK